MATKKYLKIYHNCTTIPQYNSTIIIFDTECTSRSITGSGDKSYLSPMSAHKILTAPVTNDKAHTSTDVWFFLMLWLPSVKLNRCVRESCPRWFHSSSGDAWVLHIVFARFVTSHAFVRWQTAQNASTQNKLD